MQKRRNDVKARTTLLLALPDEHQLRFSKYKTAQELWAAILKTFGGNEATKKTKKNLLKQQYGNFKAEGKKTLEQTFNRLQAINMAFISSSKNSSGNEEDNTAGVPTTNTQVSTAGATVAPAKMDIKWNMALLSMRADRYWKKTGKKISIQGTDVAGFDKSKSFMANEEENHALIADEEAPIEFAPMAKTSADSEVFDNSLCSKNCLSQVEGRLVEFKNQEIKFYEKVRVLKFNIEGKTNRIEYLTKELENLKNEKEGLESKLTGLPEFADDTITDYTRPSPSVESNPNDLQNSSSSASENGESTGGILSKPKIKFVRPADTPTVVKIDKVETAKKPTVKYAEQYIKPSKTSNVRGNQRNWNNLKPQQLDENFVMKKRSCFNCGHFDHLSYDCSLGMKRGRTYPTNTHKSTSPRPVVHKTHRPQIRPIRPNVNAAQPKRTSFYKLAHSHNKRSLQRTSAVRSQFRGSRVATVNKKFPTVNRKFPTVNRKFPTGNTKFSTADMGNKEKADSGCSRHMTGNISYLSDYEPFDGGYVSFGQGGCKITGKGTIKTDKLEFENVYFMKDLKYNLFSVSQICDNKNSVIFTNSECIVLGRDFKLTNDNNVLLRTPRQHNMYSIDLNNIVLHKDLTFLVAKASADEFRGLPTKCFENDHNCTACLKGKQHKASCKTKLVNSVTKPLHALYMDLFGTTSAEAVNTACYVQNRVLVNKSQNKTPYELFNEKFEAKGDEGYFIGYSMSSKAFRKDVSSLRYIVLPNWLHETHLETSTSNAQDACNADAPESSGISNPTATSTNPPADHMETLVVETPIPTVSSSVLTACLNDSPKPSSDTRLIFKRVTSQDDTPSLDNILTLTNRFEDILGVTTNIDGVTTNTDGVEADIGNMETTSTASPTPTLRIHKDHPKSQIIGPVDTPIQSRNKSKEMEEQSFIATIHQKINPALLQFCLFSCFLSQEEPKKISDALHDPNWDERRVVIKNKARLVAQGHTQEEKIDYDEVFSPVARIEAIRLFLAYASFIGFTVYQKDVKSAFLYDTIDEEVYVMQPSGFYDPEFPARVYKVKKGMYELHQAPRAWYGTLSKYLLTNGFQRDQQIPPWTRRILGEKAELEKM
nr:hypothetical protein [Tanacetum cinerariifolium]